MRAHPLRLTRGMDLKAELDALVASEGWRGAFVLSGIGSLSRYAIRFAQEPEAEEREGAFEIVSLGGTLSPDGSHLHIVVSDAQGTTLGGHLKEGAIVNTTAEILIAVLDGWELGREMDPVTGYPELAIRQLP